jgi:hypothetical protein
MDQLEVYLQCFDEEYRPRAKTACEKYLEPYATAENLQWFFLHRAFYDKKHDALHKLIDLGFGRTPKSAPRVENHPFDPTIQLMYDRGFTTFRVKPSHQLKLLRFLDCRECARKAAIAVMGCFFDGRGAAVGRNAKDVGRIIGRVIWASRGIKEWIK